MTDTELQYIGLLKKDCQQNGTWTAPITSDCLQKGLIETDAKVCIFYFFVNEFDL